MKNILYTGDYAALEIFAKSEENTRGKVRVRKAGRERWEEYPAGSFQYRLLRIPLERNTDWEVEPEGCTISLAYLSEWEDLLDAGVGFLEYKEGEWHPVRDLGAWYDTPNREQYHFNPYKNWINDPNGLCWYQGYYHMYYQANPHNQQWDHMYWGHAASRDLVHWIHLPYVLTPQEEILEAADKKGGAFSGSAVALEDEIVFYLTRHLGPMAETEENTVQYQTMTKSRDSIHFQEEVKIIEKPGEDISYNFRDPKVIWLEGQWQMVLGTMVQKVPAIVRYTSRDMENWEYRGPLLEERTEGVYTFECPDFFLLSGKLAAAGAWMYYTDEQGRYQPTWYYLGDLIDGRLRVEKKGLYDFGTNFYAVQSFEHQGRRIAIGWISDFYQEHRPEENGAYGSMAIPRELFLQDGKLYRRPVREIYGLKENCICSVEGQNLSLKHMNRNCYYGKLVFRGETDFTILLGVSCSGSIRLIREGKQLWLETQGVKSQGIRFETGIDLLKELEIFVDRRVVEVFVNGGEEAGTKLFYQDGSDGVFRAEFEQEDRVEWIEIYSMKSIWG